MRPHTPAPIPLHRDIGWAAVSAAAAVAALCWLCWPVLLQPDDAVPTGYFAGGHVWVMDHVAAVVRGEQPWSTQTRRLGFPQPTEVRPIALAPSVLLAPLRGLLSPLGRYNLALALGFGGAAAACHLLLRALGARAAAASGAALVYALCPFALGALSSGQLAKVQHWGLPLIVWCWVRAAQGSAGAVLATPLAAAALAFTAPTQSLWAPLAGAALLPSVAWDLRRRGLGVLAWRALLVAASLGLTAAVLVYARHWYEPALPGDAQAFVPAVRLTQRTNELSAVSTLPELLLGPSAPTPVDWRTVSHVGYLGLPGVAFALATLPWARRPLAGLGVLVLGGTLALGPLLLLSDGPALVGGMNLTMPAALLDHTGYPTARSGMYYRAALLGSLGIAILAAGAASRMRWGALLVWGLAAAQLCDSVRATPWLWPRSALQAPGLELARQMAADPLPGAVVHTPLQADDGVGSLHLLTAAVHQRTTSAVPRNSDPLTRTAENRALLAGAVASGSADALRRAGVRYVTRLDGVRVSSDEPTDEALERLLGPATQDGWLRVWTVSPP